MKHLETRLPGVGWVVGTVLDCGAIVSASQVGVAVNQTNTLKTDADLAEMIVALTQGFLQYRHLAGGAGKPLAKDDATSKIDIAILRRDPAPGAKT